MTSTPVLTYSSYDKKKLILPIFFILLLLTGLFFLPVSFKQRNVPLFSEGIFTVDHLLISLIFLAIAWLFNTFLEIHVWHRVAKKYNLVTVPRILRTGAALFLYLAVIIFILGFVADQSISTLIAATGALGIIIGFALRSAIEGVFNSLFVNIENTFRIGDIIFFQQGGSEIQAQVIDISWRTTVLQDILGNILVIPNSSMSSTTIKKCSSLSKSYCYSQFFTINLNEVSIKKSLRLLEAALKSNEHILTDPAPSVTISDITDNTTHKVKYELRYWLNPHKSNITKVKHNLYREIYKYLAILTPNAKKDSDKETITVLQHVPLFSEFSEEEIAKLSNQINRRVISKDQTLINYGETGNSMFILVEGMLQVMIKIEAKDELIPIAKIAPGAYFGEMSLLTGEPRSATVTALTDAVVYEITKEIMASLFEKNPELIKILSNKIANIQVANLRKIQDYSEQESVQEKVKLSDLLFNKIINWFGHAK